MPMKHSQTKKIPNVKIMSMRLSLMAAGYITFDFCCMVGGLLN